MNWSVYILLSKKDFKTYCGSTNDLVRRVAEHNNGSVTATKNRRPLEIINVEKFETEINARQKEQYFKTSSGRKKLKVLIDQKIQTIKQSNPVPLTSLR